MKIDNPTILIVDDDDCAALLMRTVFERAEFVEPLQFARDGAEALAYLRGDGAYADRGQFPFPTVVLLDLNMPGKNGFEVLTWIRRQPALKRLRVYIMSASSRPEDIERAYDLGANSYLVKPGNLDGLMNQAKCLLAWLRCSHFAPAIPPSQELGSVTPFMLEPRSIEPGESAAGESTVGEAGRRIAQLEARLKAQDAELDALRAEREKWGHSIAHDLRGPLMSIGGFTELMLENSGAQLDDKGRQYLARIATSADQLGRMLSEIAAHSKANGKNPAPHGVGLSAQSPAA